MKIKLLISSFAILFFFLISCHTRVIEGASTGVRFEGPRDLITQLRMNSVAILDKNLQTSYVYENSLTGKKEYGSSGKIAIESTGAKRTSTGTLNVWALIRNRTDYNLTIEARVSFFDSNKIPIEGPTMWFKINLTPNGLNNYKEFSVNNTNISYYYIEIREAI